MQLLCYRLVVVVETVNLQVKNRIPVIVNRIFTLYLVLLLLHREKKQCLAFPHIVCHNLLKGNNFMHGNLMRKLHVISCIDWLCAKKGPLSLQVLTSANIIIHLTWGKTLTTVPNLPVYDLQCTFCYLITMYNSGFTEGVLNNKVFHEDFLLYWRSLFNTNGFGRYHVRCISPHSAGGLRDSLSSCEKTLFVLPSAGEHTSVKCLWIKAVERELFVDPTQTLIKKILFIIWVDLHLRGSLKLRIPTVYPHVGI